MVGMFSSYFLSRCFYLAIKHPSVVMPMLQGKNVADEIRCRRMKEWNVLRKGYHVHPKKTHWFRIYLNPGDNSYVSSSISTTGCLGIGLTSLILKIVKPGMRVVDVGANLGYYSLLLSKLVGTGGEVHAFEPDPLNFSYLTRSIRENGVTNVVCYQQALSDMNGVISLFKADPTYPHAHSLVDMNMETWSSGSRHGVLDVPTRTLDSIWRSLSEPRIDFLKVHVAGGESIVLRGAMNMLEDSRPLLSFVMVPENWRESADVLETLFSLYDVYRLVQTPFLIKKVELKSVWNYAMTELVLRANKHV